MPAELGWEQGDRHVRPEILSGGSIDRTLGEGQMGGASMQERVAYARVAPGTIVAMRALDQYVTNQASSRR